MFETDLEGLITEVTGWVATDCALEASFNPFWAFLASTWIILPETSLDQLEVDFEPWPSLSSRTGSAKLSSSVWSFTTRSTGMFSGCSASFVELCWVWAEVVELFERPTCFASGSTVGSTACAETLIVWSFSLLEVIGWSFCFLESSCKSWLLLALSVTREK